MFGPTLKDLGGLQVYFSSAFPLSESADRFYTLVKNDKGLREVWLKKGAVGYKNKYDVEGERRNSEGLLEGATVFKYTWPVGSKPPIKRYFLRPLLRYGVVSFTSKGNFNVTLPLS